MKRQSLNHSEMTNYNSRQFTICM